MPDLPTRLDLFAIGRDHVLTRAKRITPEQVNTDGSDANIVTASSSFMGQEVVFQLAKVLNSLLLDGARGEDLDRLAFDRYQLTRKGAAAALGSVEFTRPDVTAGAGSLAVGTKVIANGGAEYLTTTTATFAAADLSASANVRAVLAGSETQVGANTLRRIDNPSSIFEPRMSVNNALGTAGGEPIEDDDTFRERVRDFFVTARRGTLGAIEFGALTVGGVVSAAALEAITTGNQPARVVTLFVADSSGSSNPVLGAQVEAALEDFRAGGITVLVQNSVPQIADVVLTLSFVAGVDTATLTENIRSAVIEFVNSLSVNGVLYRADLFSVLRRFVSDGLIQSESMLVEPTGDLIPDAGKTIRVRNENVSLA